MARRRKESTESLVMKLIMFGAFLLIVTGALPFFLHAILIVVSLAGIVLLLIWLFPRIESATLARRQRLQQKNAGGTAPINTVVTIDVECPQCKSVLVAPVDLVGHTVTCEGCRHEFEIGKPKVKMPDSTKFRFPNPPTAQFSSALLRELEWKRFEQLVEGFFEKSGWETRPNRIGADGGVDVHLIRQGQPGIAGVVQCKAWNAYTVGVKPIRELFGVMAADRVPEGFFVTTGDYTSEARSFAFGKPMTLIDGSDLLNRLESLTPEAQTDLYARVTSGDYTIPTCPQCGIKMVRREAGKGRGIGNEFWGCPKYPRCRQTFQMKKDV